MQQRPGSLTGQPWKCNCIIKISMLQESRLMDIRGSPPTCHSTFKAHAPEHILSMSLTETAHHHHQGVFHQVAKLSTSQKHTSLPTITNWDSLTRPFKNIMHLLNLWAGKIKWILCSDRLPKCIGMGKLHLPVALNTGRLPLTREWLVG